MSGSTRGRAQPAAHAGSAPFGTDYNPTTPGKLVGGRQRADRLPAMAPPEADNIAPTDLVRYRKLPALGHGGFQSSNRPATQSSTGSLESTEPTAFSTGRSYAAKVIVQQIRQGDAAAATDLENRFRRLQRDHRDCVEFDDVMRATRSSSIRLDAANFVIL